MLYTAMVPWPLFAITNKNTYLAFSLLIFQLLFFFGWIYMEKTQVNEDDE